MARARTPIPVERACNGPCGQTKPIGEFNKRTNRGIQGYQYKCRECQRDAKTQWDGENVVRVAQYVEDNREAIALRMQVWRGLPEVRERHQEQARQWARENRELRNASASRRRARLLNAFVEDVIPFVVLERDDNICGICDEDVDPYNFHVDHIIPLALGGEHSYANTQVAHPDCNIRKGVSI